MAEHVLYSNSKEYGFDRKKIADRRHGQIPATSRTITGTIFLEIQCRLN